MARHASTLRAFWLRVVFGTLVGVALVASLAIYRMHATRILSVESNSMAPALVTGDAVILKPAPLKTLKVGDIVSYRNPTNPNVIITHRIVFVDSTLEALVTKGDNVPATDDQITASVVLGRVSYTAARLGYVLSFLRTPLGLIATIYIPTLIILWAELRHLTRFYGQPTYRLHSGAI
jgi:signal peptidase I